MTPALIGFSAVIGLCLLGLPLAFVTLGVGLVGFAWLRGWNWNGALTMMGQQVMDTAGSYWLSVIPLFVLMGVFIHRAHISEDLFRAAHGLVGHRRGGLAQASVLASAAFSAVSGSSLATAATMTKIAMPQMRAYGYDDRLSSGVVAAGGTLGIMIPPSVPLVVYGLIAAQDIGKLFAAGMVPGLLLVALFMATVAVTVRLWPAKGPAGRRLPGPERRTAFLRVWPVLVLFAVVLGGILLGVFTPTEAAGIGAFAAGVFAFARGHIQTLKALFSMLIEAVHTSAALFAVIFGALVFANFISLSGLPNDLLDLVDAFAIGPLTIVVLVCAICLVLGMVFETIGILLLITPIFLPVLHDAGVDLIWFGIVMIIVIELGLITPPIGLNVFTVRSVMPGIALGNIFRGVIPFVIADLVALALLLAFPGIALALLHWL
ncbi:TRAP transporter large permease [Lutimaribacter sp. EGI FJ00015]|uniref:TRAP transporter large permease n=1 Tax=Lutimaribacter degradans TaxID=2945989 RepID=A0ACC5ZXA0_9RHOB|nr:TRAP transporter large permease [Lutimaribacter sp. EGI FJ00013]MCM2562957.1 TRAP transporter large permease [Lutimaribacter sp. EGI FJ00013]MCO0614125.1 TRAP transporter large permease [Lutimaribacter sp. EGI FJ00015]MCO0636102.1 TRAP transporter large permease [Lutimaribacter sp. EGI FJ00014]